MYEKKWPWTMMMMMMIMMAMMMMIMAMMMMMMMMIMMMIMAIVPPVRPTHALTHSQIVQRWLVRRAQLVLLHLDSGHGGTSSLSVLRFGGRGADASEPSGGEASPGMLRFLVWFGS